MQEFCGKKRFVVGITGASGIRLGIRFAGHLARFAKNSEIFVIFSNGAKMVAQYEDKIADILSDSRIKSLLDLVANQKAIHAKIRANPPQKSLF